MLAAASGLRADLGPQLRAEGSPIGQIIDFVQVVKDGGLPPLTGEHPEVLRLYFCDQDPEHCWDSFTTLADDVAAQGARLELAAPFIPTIPGTTRYHHPGRRLCRFAFIPTIPGTTRYLDEIW